MTDMNQAFLEAARRGRVRFAAGRPEPEPDKPRYSMNELLRAAHHEDSAAAQDRYRATLDAEHNVRSGEVAGSADGGVRGSQPTYRPSSGALLTELIRDTVAARRWGREPSERLDVEDRP